MKSIIIRIEVVLQRHSKDRDRRVAGFTPWNIDYTKQRSAFQTAYKEKESVRCQREKTFQTFVLMGCSALSGFTKSQKSSLSSSEQGVRTSAVTANESSLSLVATLQ